MIGKKKKNYKKDLLQRDTMEMYVIQFKGQTGTEFFLYFLSYVTSSA